MWKNFYERKKASIKAEKFEIYMFCCVAFACSKRCDRLLQRVEKDDKLKSLLSSLPTKPAIKPMKKKYTRGK